MTEIKDDIDWQEKAEKYLETQIEEMMTKLFQPLVNDALPSHINSFALYLALTKARTTLVERSDFLKQVVQEFNKNGWESRVVIPEGWLEKLQ